MKRKLGVAVAVLLSGCYLNAFAAQGEMGTGVPNFGNYGDPVGGNVVVFSLINPTIGFPPDCQSLTVSPATFGATSYKVAITTLLTAKALGRPVRFYAHASRDGGCGVDFVQLMD
jgi:hypothetical protein